MKSLKYRRKIGRNVQFQDEKLNIVDKKIDEKNSCYIKFEQLILTDLNIYLRIFWVGKLTPLYNID